MMAIIFLNDEGIKIKELSNNIIPVKGDLIVINDIKYSVKHRLIDYDLLEDNINIILIHLESL